ncbi:MULTISPECIES: EAL and HDOD domain-containing protein [Pseudoalteromonas]|uniref:EAL and HDOD domain-containing protein n=1 Tax=Pseudoalteromonas TaxID=53246 RepID=UPI0005FA3611|nr:MULTISPECIES: HDOD domain-containing protein [Pseudoalteromonas]KJY93528.1 diguanylate phosphodiesterase [Pseudoalteromonas piscicida]MCG7541420.1 HDOD domain-containing protein [Pseudoalteromonas sp. OF7H-1]MCG9767622.1 HDOD domain-containing protein [Pseudoalteromonas piscicida]ODB35248.1 diguanylate phosphodiesterase [Pseudoalteromonas sp. BMB]QZO12509.1 HDOD domain-containing protein [Pseudoalteromonas piscicida]
MLMSGPVTEVRKSAVQYIARQAILRPDQEVFAYELLYRDSDNNAFPVGVSDGQATGRMFFNSLMFIGVDRLAAGQLAFINLSDESLLQELPSLLAPQKIVVEIVERSKNIPSLVNTVTKLTERGYRFALDDYDGTSKWDPLLPLMEFVKIEVEQPIIKTNMTVKKLKRQYPDIKVIVERIETKEEFEIIKSSGADFFQGFFFAKPEMLNHGNVEPSKMVVFQLLQATARKSLCFKEIQTRVSKDLSLTARLLKLANAKAGEDRLEIKSISQAVVYLGEDAIRQFVKVLALSELGSDKPSELTRMGLTRAKFVETFLMPGGEEMAETGYLLGLMSILDVILDVDLAVIAAEFSLDDSLSSALLSYQGLLGGALRLAFEIERNDWREAELILQAIRPATPTNYLYDMALSSRAYADEILSIVAGDEQ